MKTKYVIPCILMAFMFIINTTTAFAGYDENITVNFTQKEYIKSGITEDGVRFRVYEEAPSRNNIPIARGDAWRYVHVFTEQRGQVIPPTTMRYTTFAYGFWWDGTLNQRDFNYNIGSGTTWAWFSGGVSGFR